MGDRPTGPLGVDPLHYSVALFSLLLIFVLYLLLPRGLRVQHFRAYPKRYAWSARPRAKRGVGGASGSNRGQGPPGSTAGGASIATGASSQNYRNLSAQGIGIGGGGSVQSSAYGGQSRKGSSGQYRPPTAGDASSYGGGSRGSASVPAQQAQGGRHQMSDMQQQQNDEIVISAAMQQLRDPGVLIVAHGSRGKPKTVRLQLTETAITWRTETRKKSSGEPKVGKLHQVPLSHIMYVDVGKQTTALRRVENAAVSEALCFSLLTKEGSLDLEANSPRERDALVSCFSLVLDEVHAQNWRDIYRGPSSEMPSSFDDMDDNAGGSRGANNV